MNKESTNKGRALKFTQSDLREHLERVHPEIHEALPPSDSVVDFPTLAGWLGHKDGSILASKDHGHLVPDHSSSQARKIVA